MPTTVARSKTRQDPEAALYSRIADIARTNMRRIVPPEELDDLVGDVVLECLEQFQANPDTRPARLPGFVRQMARRRVADLIRLTERDESRHVDHGREISEGIHAWMAPDASLEAQEMDELLDRAVATLPEACARVYSLVRDEGKSHEEVAQLLGLSRSAIESHMTRAQDRFRRELEQHGIKTRAGARPTKLPPSMRKKRRTARRARARAERMGQTIARAMADDAVASTQIRHAHGLG